MLSTQTIFKQKEYTDAMPKLTPDQARKLAMVTGQPMEELERSKDSVPDDVAFQLAAMQKQIADLLSLHRQSQDENTKLKAKIGELTMNPKPAANVSTNIPAATMQHQPETPTPKAKKPASSGVPAPEK